MERVGALLEQVARALTGSSSAAIGGWLLAAGALILALVLAYRLRRRPRDDVQRIFLASASASRKAREISEIDAFARRTNANAEELKARVRTLRSGHFQQAKIYIDHSNFIRTWTQIVHSRDRPLEHDVNWATLPQVLMEETAEWLESVRKQPQPLVYRGSDVYGTLFHEDYFRLLETMLRLEKTAPDRLPLPIRLRKETVDRWREENDAHRAELTRTIQQQVGYRVVPIIRRTPREDQLSSSNFTSGGIPIAPEKMLDTQIATDLLADATFDVYDVALLISEDSDFIPAVDLVQDMLGKQVVQVGFGAYSNELRGKCRHRIDLGKGRLFERMQRGRSGKTGADAAVPIRGSAAQQGRRSDQPE